MFSLRHTALTERPTSLCPYSKSSCMYVFETTVRDNVVWIYILFQVIDRLSGVGVSGEVCKVIEGCVSVRSEEVRTQLLRDTAKVSPSSLSDFDWKLKVSLFIPHLIICIQRCIYT